MTDAQSTLARMAQAVKNSHTAITVLKKENEELKSENHQLKETIARLQAKLKESTNSQSIAIQESNPTKDKPYAKPESSFGVSTASLSTWGGGTSLKTINHVGPKPKVTFSSSEVVSQKNITASKITEEPKIEPKPKIEQRKVVDISYSAKGLKVPQQVEEARTLPVEVLPKNQQLLNTTTDIGSAERLGEKIKYRARQDWDSLLSMKLIDYSANKKEVISPQSLLSKLSHSNYQSVAKSLLQFPVASIYKLIPQEIHNWINESHVQEWKTSRNDIINNNNSSGTTEQKDMLPKGIRENLNLFINLFLSMAIYSTNTDGHEYCLELMQKMFLQFVATIRLRQGHVWISLHTGAHEFDSILAILAHVEHVHLPVKVSPPSKAEKQDDNVRCDNEEESNTMITENPTYTAPVQSNISNNAADDDILASDRKAQLAAMFSFSSDEEEEDEDGDQEEDENSKSNKANENDDDDDGKSDETSCTSSDDEMEEDDEEEDAITARSQSLFATSSSSQTVFAEQDEDETINKDMKEEEDNDANNENEDITSEVLDQLLCTLDMQEYCILSIILNVWGKLGHYDLIVQSIHEISHVVNIAHSIGSGLAINSFLCSFPQSKALKQRKGALQDALQSLPLYQIWMRQCQSFLASCSMNQTTISTSVISTQHIIHPHKYEQFHSLLLTRSQSFLQHIIAWADPCPTVFPTLQPIEVADLNVSALKHTTGLWKTLIAFPSELFEAFQLMSWKEIGVGMQAISFAYCRSVVYPQENLSFIQKSSTSIRSIQDLLAYPVAEILFSRFGTISGFPAFLETCRTLGSMNSTATTNARAVGEEYQSLRWETFLTQTYANYWYDMLTTCSDSIVLETRCEQLTTHLSTMNAFFHDYLFVYYDRHQHRMVTSPIPLLGWKGGNIGEGQALTHYLKTRMSIIRDHLSKVQGIIHRMRPKSTTTNTTIAAIELLQKQNMSAYFWQYSSTSYTEVQECLSLLVYLQDSLFTQYTLYEAEFTPTERSAYNKLRTIVIDTLGLLGVAQLERMVWVFVCASRGLLQALTKRLTVTTQQNVIPSKAMLNLTLQCIRIVEDCPNPWGSANRMDLQYEIVSLAEVFVKHYSHNVVDSSPNSAVLPHFEAIYARYLNKYPNEICAFVINLDRRSDRWKRTLTRSLATNVLKMNLFRVQAIDAKYFDTTDSSPSAALSVGMNAQLLNEMEVIPEKDVVTTWDTTLNAKFDSRCPVDEHMKMTSSERACAASHLKIWRAIASLSSSNTSPLISSDSVSLGWSPYHNDAQQIAKKEETIMHKLWGLQRTLTTPTRSASTTGAVNTVQHFFTPSSSGSSIANADPMADYFLILEDDASVPTTQVASFHASLQKILSRVPDDWEIIYLGGVTPRRSRFYHETTLKGGQFYKINYMWMLHGYVIRQQTAKKLLHHLPINGPVDNFIASLLYDQVLTGYLVGEQIIKQVGVVLSQRKEDSNIRHSGVSILGASVSGREHFHISSKLLGPSTPAEKQHKSGGGGQKRKRKPRDNNKQNNKRGKLAK